MSTPADRAYTNAREEGRTAPGKVEIISKSDPRHLDNRGNVAPNRADARAAGYTSVTGDGRKVKRPRYTQPHPLSRVALQAKRAERELGEKIAERLAEQGKVVS